MGGVMEGGVECRASHCTILGHNRDTRVGNVGFSKHLRSWKRWVQGSVTGRVSLRKVHGWRHQHCRHPSGGRLSLGFRKLRHRQSSAGTVLRSIALSALQRGWGGEEWRRVREARRPSPGHLGAAPLAGLALLLHCHRRRRSHPLLTMHLLAQAGRFIHEVAIHAAVTRCPLGPVAEMAALWARRACILFCVIPGRHGATVGVDLRAHVGARCVAGQTEGRKALNARPGLLIEGEAGVAAGRLAPAWGVAGGWELGTMPAVSVLVKHSG